MIRCEKCARFTRDNVALRGFDQIKEAHGDCSRCGPGVLVTFDAWEDWGWSEEDDRQFEDRLVESTYGWASLPHEVTAQMSAAPDPGLPAGRTTTAGTESTNDE